MKKKLLLTTVLFGAMSAAALGVSGSFEVGTEESIRGYDSISFENFLEKLRLETKENFMKVKYGVIQSGTKLELNSNIGNFDKDKSIEFIEICKKFNIKSKEHNGDYLSIPEIKKRFELGLSAINIAPEFGYIETKCILEEIESLSDKVLYDKLFEICYESNNWVKWIPKDKVNNLFKNNKNAFIETSCHYIFGDPDFLKIKHSIPKIEEKIKKTLSSRVKGILCAIK